MPPETRSRAGQPPGGVIRPSIFVCYRREDIAYARNVFEKLQAHFGEGRVFWDLDNIEWGTDFVESIDRAISSSAALVVIVGKDWLQTGPTGDRGIHDPTDFVRLEVTGGIKAGKPILPALVGAAEMPSAKDLPKVIKQFARIQANRLSDDNWATDVAKLVGRLDSVVAEPAAAGAGSLFERTTPRSRAAGAPAAAKSTARPGSTAGAAPGTPRPTLLGAQGFPPTARPGSTAGAAPGTPRPTLLGAQGFPPTARALPHPMLVPRPPAGYSSYEEWRNSPAAKEMRAQAAAREAEKKAARAAMPEFYATFGFWIAVVVTIAACAGAVWLADAAVAWGAGVAGLALKPTDTGILAALVGLAWSLAYVARGAIAYADDPRPGAKVFYTGGILGSWLAYGDSFVTGVMSAFPLSILLNWGLARLAYSVLGGSIVILIVLIVYTVVAISRYLLADLDLL